MTRYHTYNSLDSSPRTTEPRHILDANDAPEIRDRWRKVLGRQTILTVRQREGERWGYCGFGWFRHDLSGTNRAGNTWTKVRFAPNPMHFTRNTYFYENKDGSYFQINPDGSGFYDNRRGGVRYVDAEGNVLKKGLPDNSAAASGHSDAGISSSSINAKAEDCKKEEEGGNAVMKKEEEGGEVDLLRLEEQGNQDITIKSEKPEPVDHNQRVEIKKERSDSSSSLVSVSSYASDTLTAASSVGSLDGANGVWIKPEPVD